MACWMKLKSQKYYREREKKGEMVGNSGSKDVTNIRSVCFYQNAVHSALLSVAPHYKAAVWVTNTMYSSNNLLF